MSVRKCFVSTLAVALVIWSVGLAPAETLTIFSDVASGSVGYRPRTDSMIVNDGLNPRVGSVGSRFTSDGRVWTNHILFFQLPTVNSADDILDASFAVDYSGWESADVPPPSLDLYALGHVATTDRQAEWYFTSDNDTRYTLIENDFVTTSAYADRITSPSANTVLRSFVQDAYNSGASAGDFLVLRLNPDYYYDPNSPLHQRGYLTPDAWNEGFILTLNTLNTIPEPSTIVALLGMGTVGLLLAWRRKKRTADDRT